MKFRDRTEAGLLLIAKLKNYDNKNNAIVVTIPRGGVPVAYTIAKQLHLPLDIVLSKKIGHPSHKEFAIGAVTLSDRIISYNANDISKEYLDNETNNIRMLLQKRHKMYFGSNKAQSLKNKIVILVDDGVATGNTLISSIKLIEKQHPSKIIVALPVGPPDVINKINNMPAVDQTISLLKPNNFYAVGQFYEEFNQVNDKDVTKLLKEANNNFQLIS